MAKKCQRLEQFVLQGFGLQALLFSILGFRFSFQGFGVYFFVLFRVLAWKFMQGP